ncbi:DUF6011 domain-containing protein [Streptomyces sp. NPDC088789]|uniref:DUF6011 domain-containing protein n=1 Tax=Streptomyces sp. NPDC088789 TaxID=3365899 RepID=UPI003818B539
MTERPPRCRLCARLLADPASVARGAGPTCHRKLSGHTAPRVHIPQRTDTQNDIPGQLAIPIQDTLPTPTSSHAN